MNKKEVKDKKARSHEKNHIKFLIRESNIFPMSTIYILETKQMIDKEEEPFKESCSSSVCGASNLQRIHSACCNMLLPHTYAVHVQLTLM